MKPADRLRALMHADALPDKAKAESVGLSPAYWSSVKNGFKADVELQSAAKILTALGKTFADLDDPT